MVEIAAVRPDIGAMEAVQLLTPEGVRRSHAEFEYTGDDAAIAAAYREMVLTRRVDQESVALQRQGELGMWPPCLGQEAAQVGSARAVGGNDFVVPSYREHGVALHMGIDPLDLTKVFRGVAQIDWDSVAHRFHLYSFVIGAQTLHATGYAMGMAFDGMVGNEDPEKNGAVICYFGDGATSQGDVNEAFIFAMSYEAPVVFFCQNNQWAISEPIERQSKIPLYQRAYGFGMPSVRVDGNDVLATQAVTAWALDRARNGLGPTFIEAFTYRMGAHTTSDDPTKYREREEEEKWRGRDPIARVRKYLEAQGYGADFFSGVDAEADSLTADLRRRVLELPDPTLDEMFDRVYVERPARLSEQQADYRYYRDNFMEAQA